MSLSDSQVTVTTQQEIDLDTHLEIRHRLSEYGDMVEFYSACSYDFPGESDPLFRYPSWENIPDPLINRQWLCPNFFEIREALERLDEEEAEAFMAWCGYQGHDIATDDAYVLVANYLDNHSRYPELENELPEVSDEGFACQDIPGNYFETERFSYEIFTDNYD